MIVAEQKPFPEILKLTEEFENILVVGCNSCVAVCLTGGEKEAELLAAKLRIARKRNGTSGNIDTVSVLRQCEREYVDEVAKHLGGRDLILSTACGIGPQALAERYPDVRVLPAMNTNMLGMVKEHHVWTEFCAACGECIIDRTGGICPIARCAKTLLNGPCGGSQGGRCEISADVACVWHQIYEKLSSLGLSGMMEELMGPKDWSKSGSGGPRTMKKEGFEP